MTTDELILQLAQSATAVKRLAPPSTRTFRWLLVAASMAVAAVIAIGPRADLDAAVTKPAFVLSLAALIGAAVSAAAVALAMSVPGTERSPRRRALPVAAVVAWAATWLLVLATSPGHARLFHAGCAVEIAALSGVCGWVLVGMLRQAAPLLPAWTSAIAAIASVTVGAAATQVICPIDDPRHQLVGHVLVAVVVGVAAFIVGRGRLAAQPFPRPQS